MFPFKGFSFLHTPKIKSKRLKDMDFSTLLLVASYRNKAGNGINIPLVFNQIATRIRHKQNNQRNHENRTKIIE